MSTPTLVIGNKNYSSWSLRPWLFLKNAEIPFKEIRISLFIPNSAEKIAQYSPSGRVPVLLDGGCRVWESLAICEYLAECYPQAQAWPADRDARALARAVSCEMHAGFAALRTELPMNCRARRAVDPSPEAHADIARIIEIWLDCRERYGQN
jgi:glutathione S-transferase